MFRTARAHLERGNHAAAVAVAREIVRLKPTGPEGLLLLGAVLQESGQPAEAERTLRGLAELVPGSPEVHYNLGNALVDLNRQTDAEAAYRKAVELAPRFAPGHYNLANCLRRQNRLDEAALSLETAASCDPRLARIHYNLGNARRDQGRVPEAVLSFERAIAIEPASSAANTNRLMALNYLDTDPAQVTAAHRAWGDKVQAAAGPVKPHRNTRDLNRRLRVGVLSPDLRQHSCSFFLEPLLASLDRDRFELCCYHTHPTEDAVSERFKGYARIWRNFASVPDQQADAAIRADSVDVLIECAGLTDGNRLALLARKPAPVVITWLGYPNTTGLTRVDWRMVDAHSDPPGSEGLCTEKLLRIESCNWCYRPFDGAPDPAPAPILTRGHITFGSFNNLSKLSDRCVALWARALREVPGSRLLVKNSWMGDPGTRDHVRSRFGAAGVDPARLDTPAFVPGFAPHLASYAQIDVQLDTFPYHGTTTTCESLWQGVPVLTLLGRCHAARVGASLLNAVGLPEFACGSEDEFVKLAQSLASSPDRLANLRSGLRGRMAASPLRDEKGFAGRFADALSYAWRAWCELPGV